MFNPQTKGRQQPGQVPKQPTRQPADAPLALISPNPGWQLRLLGCRSSGPPHFLIRIIFFDGATRELISPPAGAGARTPPGTTEATSSPRENKNLVISQRKRATFQMERQEVKRESVSTLITKQVVSSASCQHINSI